MTVHELITLLNTVPQNTVVKGLNDEGDTYEIRNVIIKDNVVILDE